MRRRLLPTLRKLGKSLLNKGFVLRIGKSRRLIKNHNRRIFQNGAGKSGGEFFTPQEVSEVLARIALDGRDSIGRGTEC